MLFISPPFGNYLTFLPYTTPIKGSYTLEPRNGLLMQIIQTLQYSTLHKGWINKIGLRNPGIEYGVQNYKPRTVLSLAFLHNNEILKFNNKIAKDTNIEINLSCPNAAIKFPSNLGKMINTERKWCIAKISPLEREQNIDKLYNMGFRQFHCCNTYPLALGGLSGPFLIPFVEEKIKYIRKKYKDCEIIAGGGIQNIDTLIYYNKLGANHFSVSSLCFNPIRFGIFYFNYVRLLWL